MVRQTALRSPGYGRRGTHSRSYNRVMGHDRRAVVVGGSIAGLSCAHALLQTGFFSVVVLEKAGAAVSAAGAGLGLDRDACAALTDWGLGDALLSHSLPLNAEENRAIDSLGKVAHSVARDDSYCHRAVHWSDLHRTLLGALPSGLVRFSHEVVSFSHQADGTICVEVVVNGGRGSVKTEVCDLLVAADGSMSQTRSHFVPNEERIYRGYSAWRGVLDCSREEMKELVASVHTAYPDLGNCIYFELAPGTHSVIYMLSEQRLNWLWYVNQPQPQLKGNSVTIKAEEAMIRQMHEDAERTWLPELAAVMRATTAPFVNAIFDREPLEQFVWGQVVLVGEAAHPTSPHALRSTNMSILDAASLGRCLQESGPGQIDRGLQEYQRARVGVTSKQVLFSRHLGMLKQGLLSAPVGSFSWLPADEQTRASIMQREMSSYGQETAKAAT